MKRLIILLSFVLNISCYADSLPGIAVNREKKCFYEIKANEEFFPYGVNFDHDNKYRLIEEFWCDTDLIDKVFQEINKMGFNIVRIHLQQFVLQNSENGINHEILNHLDKIVGLAENNGLYLDLTGLGRYKGEIPEWYKKLSDDERIEADSYFWKVLAEHFKNNTTIFCFDIQNEPTINGENNQGFVGPAFEDGYHYVNRQYQDVESRWDNYLKKMYCNNELFSSSWLKGRYSSYEEFLKSKVRLPGYTNDEKESAEFKKFRDYLALVWLKSIAGKIREADNSRLITVGLCELNFPDNKYYSSFSPELIKPYVDFIALHVYPRELSKKPYKDNTTDLLQMLNAAYVGKPIVIEEMFPLLPLDKLYANFIEPSRKYVCGWISFYWGVPYNELKRSDKLNDGITADWLKYFSENRNKIIGVSHDSQ